MTYLGLLDPVATAYSGYGTTIPSNVSHVFLAYKIQKMEGVLGMFDSLVYTKESSCTAVSSPILQVTHAGMNTGNSTSGLYQHAQSIGIPLKLSQFPVGSVMRPVVLNLHLAP